MAIRRSDEGLNDEYRLEKHAINFLTIKTCRAGTLMQIALFLKAAQGMGNLTLCPGRVGLTSSGHLSEEKLKSGCSSSSSGSANTLVSTVLCLTCQACQQ